MQRSGSQNRYYVKRIPADLKTRPEPLKVSVPIGHEVVPITIPPGMDTIRISLRTADPVKAKTRLVQVDEYFDRVWEACRQNAPIALTHRQATALSKSIYTAWAAGDEHDRTIAIEHTPEGWKRVSNAHLDSDVWEEIGLGWDTLEENTKKLEKAIGPIVDRLLLKEGIARVDDDSRDMLLECFRSALHDAFAQR